MTEQEKREKAIEEILKDTSDCPEYCLTHRKPWTCNQCKAERISDYILLKEEEVKKETAREILQSLRHILKWIVHDEDGERINCYEYYCKRFGVEVEE